MISSLKLRIGELETQLNEYSLNEPDLKNKLIESTEKVSNLSWDDFNEILSNLKEFMTEFL
jgi:hypothetical protein